MGTHRQWGRSHSTANSKPDTHWRAGPLFCLLKELCNRQTQDASVGKGLQVVPQHIKFLLRCSKVSKTFHFLRNFCNFLSWRGTIISPHKAELSNWCSWTEVLPLNEPRYFFSYITFCMHVTGIMCSSDSNLKTSKLLEGTGVWPPSWYLIYS